jgi:hypothetical protein
MRRYHRSAPGTDLSIGQTAPPQFRTNAGERRLQVALNVVGKRFERRDIDHLGRVGEPALDTITDQIIDRRKKCRERLAGAGWCGDQGMTAGLDRWLGLRLSGGRLDKVANEPLRDRGME